MAQATDVTQEKASVLFDNIWKTYSFMEQGEESTSSDKIQVMQAFFCIPPVKIS